MNMHDMYGEQEYEDEVMSDADPMDLHEGDMLAGLLSKMLKLAGRELTPVEVEKAREAVKAAVKLHKKPEFSLANARTTRPAEHTEKVLSPVEIKRKEIEDRDAKIREEEEKRRIKFEEDDAKQKAARDRRKSDSIHEYRFDIPLKPFIRK